MKSAGKWKPKIALEEGWEPLGVYTRIGDCTVVIQRSGDWLEKGQFLKVVYCLRGQEVKTPWVEVGHMHIVLCIDEYDPAVGGHGTEKLSARRVPLVPDEAREIARALTKAADELDFRRKQAQRRLPEYCPALECCLLRGHPGRHVGWDE